VTGRHAAGKGRHRITETSDYIAFMLRVVNRYGERVGEDPAALAHLRDIEAALRDAVNLGIYTANKAPYRPYSIGEIGAILGVSKQAAHKRVGLGEAVHRRAEGARSAGGLVRLADVRAARAAALAGAGVQDRTGSERERSAI